MPPSHFANESWPEFLALANLYGPRLGAAIIAGSLIGAENQIYGKPAGLRTSLLVTVSCCLLTIVSIETWHIYGGEPSRITAQILTGIGFIGAGVIFRQREHISGITTAATIFVNAAIGITVGTGFILSGVALALVAFVILLLLRPLDYFIDRYPPFIRLREIDREAARGLGRSRRVKQVANAIVSDEPND